MQLDNYINNGTFVHQEKKNGYIKGGTKTEIMKNVFYKRDYSTGGTYRINYWDAGDGIINYDYIYIPPKKAAYALSGAVLFIGLLCLCFGGPALALA